MEYDQIDSKKIKYDIKSKSLFFPNSTVEIIIEYPIETIPVFFANKTRLFLIPNLP